MSGRWRERKGGSFVSAAELAYVVFRAASQLLGTQMASLTARAPGAALARKLSSLRSPSGRRQAAGVGRLRRDESQLTCMIQRAGMGPALAALVLQGPQMGSPPRRLW